jgi:hypothetical protein
MKLLSTPARLTNKSQAAKAPNNPAPAIEAPAPYGCQKSAITSAVIPGTKYKMSQRVLPKILSANMPTVAIAEKLKAICCHPSA